MSTFHERHAHAVEHATKVLGEAVMVMRKQRGWVQADLARRSGVRLGTLRRIERGHYEGEISPLTKIAHAFDVALVCRFGTFSELNAMCKEGFTPPPTFNDERFAQRREGSTSEPPSLASTRQTKVEEGE